MVVSLETGARVQSESFSFAGEADSSEIGGASLYIMGGLFPYKRFSACIEKISDYLFPVTTQTAESVFLEYQIHYQDQIQTYRRGARELAG